jgi:tetratricopeptide (TPR) repeat protein
VIGAAAVLVLAQRALVMPAPRVRVARPPVVVPIRVKAYPPGVETKYLFRMRQLEADLSRDPREYQVRARLGLLLLRLATHTTDREEAARRYDGARRRFEQAAGLARTRREHEWALAQRDACSERAPVNDALDSHLNPDPVGSAPPTSVAVRDQLRMRVQFLEMRVLEQPGNARLLCRLGLTYVRCSQAMAGDRGAPGPAGGADLTPARARLRAGECLDAAARHARSQEMRTEIHLARAELHRAAGEPAAALAALQHALRLRPNHWPARLQAATLLRRLGRDADAQIQRALAARWHTPEWL